MLKRFLQGPLYANDYGYNVAAKQLIVVLLAGILIVLILMFCEIRRGNNFWMHDMDPIEVPKPKVKPEVYGSV